MNTLKKVEALKNDLRVGYVPLAEKLGIHPASIYLWKRGRKPNSVSKKKVEKLYETIFSDKDTFAFKEDTRPTPVTPNQEVKEVLSSNLSTELKVKLARLLLK